MEKKKIILDGDFLPYVICHCKKLLTEDGSDYLKDDLGNIRLEEKTWEQVKALTDSYLLNIFINTNAISYIGALTVGKVSFRYKVYPEYKGQRKYTEKPAHFDKCKEYLITEYGFVWDLSMEADDIINIIKSQNSDALLVSPDKDIMNLEGLHYNPKKNEFIEITVKQAKAFFWTSMLTGDSADNIKGIPKVGPVKANSILTKVGTGYDYPVVVLDEYVKYFGENVGIEEFYKNYNCLKILDKLPENSSLVIPEFKLIDYGNRFEKKMDTREEAQKD